MTVPNLEAGTYAVTELEPPESYEIDNPGPQYVVLPSGSDKTVTVTFSDIPEITGEGSIRKVDADDPTKGLAGAVIKIEGVDNDFTGTYVTGTGGYLTDVPWKDMPLGSFTAKEVTPPELGGDVDHVMDSAPQTAYISGKEQDVVQLYFGNSPKGSLLIKKIDASTHEPLSDCEFFIDFIDGNRLITSYKPL